MLATYVIASRREARSDTIGAEEWIRQVPGVQVKGARNPSGGVIEASPKRFPRLNAALATRSSWSLRSATSAWTYLRGSTQRRQARPGMKTERVLQCQNPCETSGRSMRSLPRLPFGSVSNAAIDCSPKNTDPD